MPGKNSFNRTWLDDDDFSLWLKPVENDKHSAFCKLCMKKFSISGAGVYAIKLHAKGKKHLQLSSPLVKGVQEVLPFRPSSNCASTSNRECIQGSEVGISKQNTLGSVDKFFSNDEVTEAEIYWSLDQVYSHSSARSHGNSTNLFKLMFKRCEVAQKFNLHKDKIGYYITYGLGPFFQSELARKVSNCDFFCISFDESLNKIVQSCQMDIIVRFWEADEIKTRYLTSCFLGSSKASDILINFISSLQENGLDLQRLLSVSMDGPNVNLKFLNDLQAYLLNDTDDSQPRLLQFGTCTLHIVHGAYKTAHVNSEWNINKFLRSLYYFFKDVPSRRNDYRQISGSCLFPQKFCSIRWVENVKVMQRAVEMLPFLRKYFSSSKKNVSSSDTSKLIQEFLSSELLEAKLCFLISIASELEYFLTTYQSNKPLLPFMYADLRQLLGNLMRRIVKDNVLKSAGSGTKLLDINLRNADNLKTSHHVDIGFAATLSLKKLKPLVVLQFRNECRNFIRELIMKLFEKSPLRNKFLKGVSCFSPEVMKSDILRAERVNLALKYLCEKKTA